MAGTVTRTTTELSSGYMKYALAWVSSGAGAVSGNAFTPYRGHLAQVKIVPAAAASQPTNLYDLTLVDADGVDLLSDAGQNLSNAAGKILTFNPPILLDPGGTLDLVIAAAGDTKGGTVTLWVGP